MITLRNTSVAPPNEAVSIGTCAEVFAALGDRTRLSVLTRLADGQPRSISRLTAGTRLTRQAVSRHLHVLQSAGVVQNVKVGRESHFQLQPGSMAQASRYLELVSRQWDDALGRLKSLVEEPLNNGGRPKPVRSARIQTSVKEQ